MKARIERERHPARRRPRLPPQARPRRPRRRRVDRAAPPAAPSACSGSPGTLRRARRPGRAGHIVDADDAAALRAAYVYCERTRNRLYLVRGAPGDALPVAARAARQARPQPRHDRAGAPRGVPPGHPARPGVTERLFYDRTPPATAYPACRLIVRCLIISSYGSGPRGRPAHPPPGVPRQAAAASSSRPCSPSTAAPCPTWAVLRSRRTATAA